jgi:hypothetical protein
MSPITRSQILQSLEFQSTEDVLAFGQAAREAVEMTLRSRGELTFSPALEAELKAEATTLPEGQPEDGEDAGGDDTQPDTLPEAFPYAKALLAGGIGTRKELAAATDEQLLGIKGIGEVALKAIRATAIV